VQHMQQLGAEVEEVGGTALSLLHWAVLVLVLSASGTSRLQYCTITPCWSS